MKYQDVDLRAGRVWKLVASDSLATVIRVEDWVNRENHKDSGTSVTYVIHGLCTKTKSLEDFLYMYKPV